MIAGKRILKNTSVLVFTQLLQHGISLLLYVVIARHLGEQVFGKFNLGLALGGLYVVLADYGMNVLLVRELANARERAGVLLSTALILKSALILGTLVVLALTAILMRPLPADRILIVILGAGLCVRSLVGTLHAVFRSHERMEYEGLFNSLDRIVTSALGIAVIFWGQGILTVAVVILLISLVNLGVSYRYVRQFIPITSWQLDWQVIRHLLQEATPFALIAIFGTICFKIDTIMLAYFQNDIQVAWYNAGFKVVFSLMFIPSAFVDSIFPVISKIAVTEAAFKRTYVKSMRMIWLVGIPLGVIVTLTAPGLIQMLYGANYAPATVVLQILIWVGIVLAATSMQSSVLAAAKRAPKIALVSALNAGANIILNLMLIPQHGYLGACIASILTLLLSLGLLSYYCHRELGQSGLMQSVLRMAFAAALMAGLLYYFRHWHPALSVPLAALFYLTAAFAVGAISRDDLRQWRQALG